jgi:hypothetical protein
MSVAEAMERIDSAEFAEWMAYERLEPFGEHRADLRSAIVACTMANAWRGKGSKTFTVKDFMPNFEPEKPMSAEEMQARLMMVFAINDQAAKRRKG